MRSQLRFEVGAYGLWLKGYKIYPRAQTEVVLVKISFVKMSHFVAKMVKCQVQYNFSNLGILVLF